MQRLSLIRPALSTEARPIYLNLYHNIDSTTVGPHVGIDHISDYVPCRL